MWWILWYIGAFGVCRVAFMVFWPKRKRAEWESKQPFPNIGCKYVRFPGSCSARVFYPCEANENYAYYTTKERTIGTLESLRLSKISFGFWKMWTQKTEFFENGKILEKRNENENQFPVIFQSHGLFGHCNMYTNVCADLASFGYVVISLEHECGSAGYAKAVGEIVKKYIRPPDGFIYKKENIEKFRKPFLEHRKKEVEIIFKNFEKINEEHFFGKCNLSKSIFLGHSFGAASTINNIMPHNSPVSGLVLHDMWAMPIQPDIMVNGNDYPIISISSQNFAENGEGPPVRQVLKNCKNLKAAVYMKDVVHTQFSDSSFWWPPFVARIFHQCGQSDPNKMHEKIIQFSVSFIEDVLYPKESEESNRLDEFLLNNDDVFRPML